MESMWEVVLRALVNRHLAFNDEEGRRWLNELPWD